MNFWPPINQDESYLVWVRYVISVAKWYYPKLLFYYTSIGLINSPVLKKIKGHPENKTKKSQKEILLHMLVCEVYLFQCSISNGRGPREGAPINYVYNKNAQ